MQEQTGIPYALLDGRFAATATAYEKLGQLTGRMADAEEHAAYTRRTLGVINERTADIPPERRAAGLLRARAARARDRARRIDQRRDDRVLVARNVAGDTRGGLATVSIEQVLLWNPDVIVTIDRDFAANVRNDPAWAAVKAVREARVHLSPKMPFGWVDFPPCVNRLIGLWWLAKILYPERFPEDLRELTRDFYRRFYHVTPSDPQIDHVLAGRD